jgi:hypothetical protein
VQNEQLLKPAKIKVSVHEPKQKLHQQLRT